MRFRVQVALPFALFVSGCASTQLTYNTVDVAGSVNSLYTQQALTNLSRFIDEPFAIPSQLDISTGVVQTSNSVTPSLSTPLSSQIQKGFSSGSPKWGVTSTQFAATGLNIGASDSWQQNWNVAPVSDANALRNLQALFRYAVYGLSDAEFKKEYHIPREQNGDKIVANPYWTLPPHCILCGSDHHVNPRLKKNWLYWTGAGAAGIENPPPAGLDTVSLGHYGNHELFISREHYNQGYLSNFVLFTLPNAEPGGGGGGGGAGSASRTGSSGNRPAAAPTPNMIVPAPQ